MEISLLCPLHPDREQLWWPELAVDSSTKVAGSLQQYFQQYFQRLLELRPWRCPFCSQNFLSAERLILHWDDAHRSQRSQQEDLVCLAEFCELFQCGLSDDELFNFEKINENERQQSEQSIARKTVSDTEENTKETQSEKIHSPIDEKPQNPLQTSTQSECNQYRLQRLQSQCGLLAQRCSIAPLQLTSFPQLQQVQQELFDSLCSSLTCDRLWSTRPFPVSF